MSYSYQSDQPQDSGALYPGWTSNIQYTSYSTPMERGTSQWSNSTGTSNHAAWSPQSEDRGQIPSTSPLTPTSASSPYYPTDSQATDAGNIDGDWSGYYDFVVPNDQRKEAYWKLQDQYEPSETFPEKRPVQRQKKSGREVYPCLFPGCTNSKPFKRTADLHRHYMQLHAPPNPDLKYYCDYPRCLRSKEPLGRKDHYRDHLRDYHGEDLVKRPKDRSSSGKGKSDGKGKDSAAGSSSRVNVNEKWWRCTKCLERKSVSDGWYCHSCKKECEEERITIRTRHFRQQYKTEADNDNGYANYSENEEEEPKIIKTEVTSVSPTTPKSYRHSIAVVPAANTCIYDCNNSWILNSSTNNWDPCPSCQASSNTYDSATQPSTYQASYANTASSNQQNLSTNMVATSTWAQPTATSYDMNDEEGTAAPAETEYKSNCGRCQNYQVYDGTQWVNCPTCWSGAATGSRGGSGSGRKEGRSSGRDREKEREKEKKKSRRSSGWFGL